MPRFARRARQDWESKLAQKSKTCPKCRLRQESGSRLHDSLHVQRRRHQYFPDFIVRIDDGRGKEDPLNLILEVTGERKKDKEAKTATARTLWVPAVNNHGGFGRWAFLEVTDPYDDVAELIRAVAKGMTKMNEIMISGRVDSCTALGQAGPAGEPSSTDVRRHGQQAREPNSWD